MTNQPGELGVAIERVKRLLSLSRAGITVVTNHDLRLILAATPTRNDGAGDVEHMRAERDDALAIAKRVQSAAKTIMIGEADELLKLREEKRGEWLASKTLDSEREANAIMTEENATLRAALSALSQKGGWQDISSAPKDGSRIDLWWPAVGQYQDAHPMYGNWCEDKYAKKPRPYFSRADERIRGISWARANQPTHWMPLPPAPVSTPHAGDVG